MPDLTDAFATDRPETKRSAPLAEPPAEGERTAISPPARQRPAGPRKFAFEAGAKPLPGATIVCGVGRGGFGEVYLAKREGIGFVALKILMQDGDVELRGVGECLELKHPNLVELRAVHRDGDGFPWVEMEYLPGPNLRQLLRRHPYGLPIGEVGRIFAGLAAGVECLHQAGVVHRDLKPANIFVGPQVKVGDYGLAKAMTSRRSGHTESVGTCHYMAPEIGNGRYGREVDIYALGVLLYELLTGRLPFQGESSQEVLMKHLTSDADLQDFSPALQGILIRSLAKNPEDRFHSAAEMALAVETALTGGECWNSGRPLPASRPPAANADATIVYTYNPPPRPTASATPRPAPKVTSESGAPADEPAGVDYWLVARLVGVVLVLIAWLIWHGWLWTIALGGASLYVLGLAIRALAGALAASPPASTEPIAEATPAIDGCEPQAR